MHLYPTRWNCFSFGRHPPVLQLCSKSCQVLAEGRVARRVCVSHRITEQSGLWRWEEDHHYHHPGTTEILSIHQKSDTVPENMCRFLGNTLCYLRGEVKSTYLSQGCRKLLRVEEFPLGEAKKGSPILLTSGLTEIAGY